MNLNQNTFVLFEDERKKYSYIPPDHSDSFYSIGDSEVSLFTTGNAFDMTIRSGEMHIGDREYVFDPSLYRSVTVNDTASVVVDVGVGINGATFSISGDVKLEENASLTITNGSQVMMASGSSLDINRGCTLEIDDDSSIMVYGTINVDVNLVDALLSNTRVIIDSSAVIKLMNVDLGDREFSLTDFNLMQRDKDITPNTMGEYAVDDGRIAYTWKDGSASDGSQCLEISTVYGSCVLGDYQLAILGKQKTLIPDLQVLESFHVESGTTVYISDSYKGYTYLRPELYLGVILGNVKEPANAVIDGTVIVDGKTSSITIDRESQLIISESGSLYIQNGAKLNSTNNGDTCVLHINGTLTIDFIDQMGSFNSKNIEFGENGKLIILNPYEEEVIVFSTPDGKYDSELYRLFSISFDHIEYHMTKNTGIKIDKYYEFFNRDLTDWFGGRRIEQAVYDGILVWEDGAFIELDSSIIPWVDKYCTLYHAARLFKTYYSEDGPRLNEVAKHLSYAGFGDVRFRFITGDGHFDITMPMGAIKMSSIVNSPNSNEYTLTTNSSGSLFMKHRATELSEDYIVSDDSFFSELSNGANTFNLD